MDFAAIFQTWVNVLTHPNEQTFESEKESPNATLQTALIWIVGAAVVTAILGFLQSVIFRGVATSSMQQFMNMADLPPEASQMMNVFTTGGAGAIMSGAGGFLGIILTPIFFMIGVGIFHLIAKLLGGQGQFDKYAYLLAAFQAPISIATAVLAFVPVLGGCIGALISIYSLVLAYFATKVNYGLTSGRAIVVVLVPLIVFFLLVICMGTLIAGLVIAGTNGG